MSTSHTTSTTQAHSQFRPVLWLLVVSLLLLCRPDVVEAAIYACRSADGSTIFQDRPCLDRQSGSSPSRSVRKLPLDIHASWFELPAQAEERAFCDRRRCECGNQIRKHGGSLAQAVADALYLDGGWHRYDTNFQLWRDEPAGSDSNPQLRDRMHEAACSVMMSQQLLRDFAEDVTEKLRREALLAEERGFDIPGPCEAGVAQACDLLDSMQLYERLLSDAQVLRLPRDYLGGDGVLPVDR